MIFHIESIFLLLHISICLPLSVFQWAGRLRPPLLSVPWLEPPLVLWSKVNCHFTTLSLSDLSSLETWHLFFLLNMIKRKSPSVTTSHTPALPQRVLISPPKSFSPPSNASQMFAKVSSLVCLLGECCCSNAFASYGFSLAELWEKLHAICLNGFKQRDATKEYKYGVAFKLRFKHPHALGAQCCPDGGQQDPSDYLLFLPP